MAFSKWASVCEEGEKDWVEYQEQIQSMSPKQILREFFSYIDLVEESDNGRIFHPITIDSVRVLMLEPLDKVLKHMRKVAHEHEF